MINIRKEQKIKIPTTYIEYLEPNFVFIPIKEKASFPKVPVKKNDIIEKIKVPIDGDILATAVNGKNGYLIIKNNKKRENLVKNERTLPLIKDKIDYKFNSFFQDKKILYVNAFDKDPSCFNNYYLLDKEEDKILAVFNFLIDNNNVHEIRIVVPATYETLIKKYQKLDNKNIKLTIVNDYFSLGYKDILSKYLRIRQNDVVSLNEIINLYYELKSESNNYLYITISGDIKNCVIKVLKYTILKEVLEYLNININEVTINLNSSLITKKGAYQQVLTEEIELIMVNKKEIIEEIVEEKITIKRDLKKKMEDECFNCGLCYMMCPWHFNPLRKQKCKECGLCSYLCPSKKVLKIGENNE